ncbi:MAG: CheR family methyltransferase [Geobacteraceae bacterium]|nr:CheR family methyltransferase [Geobacteraceae bacterium]
MYSLSPSLERGDACANLDRLLVPEIDADRFRGKLQRLQKLFEIYAATCPAPLIAPAVLVTPELRLQCESYLPLAEITAAFSHLYRSALRYPPILSSTPFFKALGWADVFVGLPPRFQFAVNPARLLENLLVNQDLLQEFLFASFLPSRFYGGFGRYPQQSAFVRQWLGQRQAEPLRCLDAACGTGEESYALAGLLLEQGYAPEKIRVEGWTLEPLEVWAAAHCSFPHDRQRERLFRQETRPLFENGCTSRILFSSVDLTAPAATEPFDLILCNGLLGGPILNRSRELELVTANLAGLLAPGGMLLSADSFHQGWKQKCPQHRLRAFLEMNGLKTFQAGEGIGGLKPD